MRFKDEITRAIKHQMAIDKNPVPKTEDEIAAINESVLAAFEASDYSFLTSEPSTLSKNGKKRYIKKFTGVYSPESILCQCIKQILDRVFRVRYPNRNKSVRRLFDTLKAVHQMSDFTIIKYDFKDYFNSVSAPYVFEKYLKEKLTDRFEIDLIKKFVEETRYTYAGFSTSNVIAEIIARQFDIAIKLAFADKGVLFFERYIDDSFLVSNEHIDEQECHNLLQSTLLKIFHDNSVKVVPKCNTKFNNSKFVHISRRDLSLPTTVTSLISTKKVDYLESIQQ